MEAAAVALMLNLGVEYAICAPQTLLPATLAHSLGATPVEVVVEYLTIIAWRIVYTSAFPPPPR